MLWINDARAVPSRRSGAMRWEAKVTFRKPKSLRDVLDQIVAFALELIDSVLDHVADAHDADQRSLIDHRHVTDSLSCHDPHYIFHTVVRCAGPHLLS